MAPYLLFGFLMAGILAVFLSPELVERHLGGRGFGSVIKASIFGMPMPLCSCGVIPVSASLRRHGASKSATIAFLISTPQTGADSMLVVYALLGPIFAIISPIAALVTGLFGGALVQIFEGKNNAVFSNSIPSPVTCTESCCSQEEKKKSSFTRIFNYGFITLPKDISVPLIVGILIAGAMGVLVPPASLHAYIGGGILSILILMAAGVPIYVCATASIPIAAGFIHMGASPGAALAFLISGPATNAATLTTIWKILGKKTAAIYLFTIAISAITFGLMLNWIIPVIGDSIPTLANHAHNVEQAGWFSRASGIVLVLLLSYACWAKHHDREKKHELIESPGMQHINLLVSGMDCSHCAESVKQTISQLPGIHSVEVDLKTGRVVVSGDLIDENQVIDAVKKLGYAVEPSAMEKS
jgi:uncharacterized membrane protein YraQ (UPF0718 family)/copper chaperone CopZ